MAPKNGTTIIKSEISYLISALNFQNKINDRSNNDDSIYKSLLQLRNYMNDVDEETNGPITESALISVEKFLSYGFVDFSISRYNQNLTPALVSAAAEAISVAIAQSRFQGANRESDESVLIKILQVIRTLILLPIGTCISNKSILDLIKNCFRICFGKNVSDLLKKSSEHTLASIIQLFFSRIPHLVSLSLNEHEVKKTLVKTDSFLNEPDKQDNSNIEESSKENNAPQEELSIEENSTVHVKPYDLTALHELLSYMTEFLNPKKSSDIQISTSLNLLTIALETGSDALSKCPSLLEIIKTKLTKYLVQLLHSEKVSIFTATCRLSLLLFESMRSQLKLQMEVFIIRIVDIISIENEKFDFFIKDIALDFITQFILLPGMLNELFLNYDCSPYTQSLLTNIADILSKNAYPVQKRNSYHLANMEVLLCMVDLITKNCNNFDSNTPNYKQKHQIKKGEFIPSIDEIKGMIDYKLNLITGSEKFNAKPSEGISYLQEHGILKKPFDPEDMAKFLNENSRLDKRTIGDYISNRKNSSVLSSFVKKLNFENVRIDDAIRIFLEAFRLPGEAPLIQHLIEYFSEQWFQSNAGVFANVDAVFTLSYAILMLNTDQHNPNSKKQNVPMNMSAFQKNLKGMNGGDNFDEEILAQIYQSIHNHEIIMPSERAGQVRDNYLWKCIMRRDKMEDVVKYHHYDNNNYFDSAIFNILWGPIISAISTIFDKTMNPMVLKKTIIGFTKTAKIASFYGQTNVIDNLMITLCKFTCLLDTSKKDLKKTPEQIVFSFGRNNKARLAASLAFTMALNYSNEIRDGWSPIIDCLLQLFKADLLPDSIVMTDEYAYMPECHEVKITSTGPRRPKLAKKNKKNDRGSETGLISSFYSYFYPSTSEIQDKESSHSPSPKVQTSTSSPPQNDSQKTDPDGISSPVIAMFEFIQKNSLLNNSIVEATARKYSLETLKTCQIDQIFVESKFIQTESLNELIRVLIHTLRCDRPYVTMENLTLAEAQMEHLSKRLHANNTKLNSKSFYQEILQKTNQIATKDDSPHTDAEKFQGNMPLAMSAHLSASDSSLQTLAQNYSGNNNNLNYFSTSSNYTAETRTFCIELLFKILIYNKDRISSLWSLVRGPICEVVMSSIQPSFFIERTLVNLIRLANRLIPRQEEMFNEIMSCLLYFLVVKSTSLLIPPDSSLHPFNRNEMMTKNNRNRKTLQKSSSKESIASPVVQSFRNWDTTYKYQNCIAQQLVGGISEFMHNHAADLYNQRSWELIFILLEICGGAVILIIDPLSSKLDPKFQDVVPSNSTLMLSHDSEAYEGLPNNNKSNWVIFDGNNTVNATASPLQMSAESSIHGGDEVSLTTSGGICLPMDEMKRSHQEMIKFLTINIEIGLRDAMALEKSVNILMFLIKDPAYLMPENLEICIHCLRIMTEACIVLNSNRKTSSVRKIKSSEHTLSSSPMILRSSSSQSNSANKQNSESSEDEDEDWDILSRNEEETYLFPITARLLPQIIDMSQTLFFRTKSIYVEWNKSNNITSETKDSQVDLDKLWNLSWLPLLKITGRICMDSRREIITEGLSLIHKQLLSADIADLSGVKFSQCIVEVLFPMLASYLEDMCLEFEEKKETKTPIFNQSDPRLRSIPLLTKCFLQRLDSLYELDNFTQIWNQILLFMQHFILASNFDILTDAVREYLKNVLLVMYTGAKDKEPILIRDAPIDSKKGILWKITIDRLSNFLPELIDQLALLDENPTIPQALTVKSDNSNPPIIDQNKDEIPTQLSEQDKEKDSQQTIQNSLIMNEKLPEIIDTNRSMPTNQPEISQPTPSYVPLSYQHLVRSAYATSRQTRFISPQLPDRPSDGQFFTPAISNQFTYDPNQYFSPQYVDPSNEPCIQQEPKLTSEINKTFQ